MTRGKEIMQEAERMFPIDIQENLDEQSDMLLRQIGFKCGAKWADKTMIDKACEWLYNALYTRANGAEHYVASKEKITQTEFVAKFRKAMEE